MREDLLTSILAELNATSADIEACAVLSTDGLMIASLLPQGLDPDRVGAMAAELSRGDLEQVMIKGGHGYVLMTHAGADAVLTVLANPQAKLGLIFLDAKRAAEQISSLLSPVPSTVPAFPG